MPARTPVAIGVDLRPCRHPVAGAPELAGKTLVAGSSTAHVWRTDLRRHVGDPFAAQARPDVVLDTASQVALRWNRNRPDALRSWLVVRGARSRRPSRALLRDGRRGRRRDRVVRAAMRATRGRHTGKSGRASVRSSRPSPPRQCRPAPPCQDVRLHPAAATDHSIQRRRAAPGPNARSTRPSTCAGCGQEITEG